MQAATEAGGLVACPPRACYAESAGLLFGFQTSFRSITTQTLPPIPVAGAPPGSIPGIPRAGPGRRARRWRRLANSEWGKKGSRIGAPPQKRKSEFLFWKAGFLFHRRLPQSSRRPENRSLPRHRSYADAASTGRGGSALTWRGKDRLRSSQQK